MSPTAIALVVMFCACASPPVVRGAAGRGGASAVDANAIADKSPIRQMEYTADGRFIVTAGAQSVKLWDPLAGKLKKQIVCKESGRGAVRFGVSADGSVLLTDAVSSGTDEVKLWKLPDGTALQTLTNDLLVPLGPPAADRIDGKVVLGRSILLPDGRSVVGVAGSDRVVVVNAASGAVLATATVGSDPLGHPPIVTAAANGSAVVVSWPLSRQVQILSLPGLAVLGQFDGPEQGKGGGPKISPDGRLVVLPVSDGTLRIYDTSGKLVDTCDNHNFTNAVAFSADGRTMATAAGGYKIQFWDVVSGKVTGTPGLSTHDQNELHLNESGTISWLAFSPNGNTLAVATGLLNSRVFLLDLKSDQVRIALDDPHVAPDTAVLQTLGSVTSSGSGSSNTMAAPNVTAGSPGAAPTMQVENDTIYTLHVALHGPEARAFQINPGATVDLSVPAGVYHVTESVSDSGVQNSERTQSFESGYRYSWRVYIQTYRY